MWRHLWLGQGRPHKPILRTGLPHQSEGGLRAGAASLSLLQHGLEGGKEVRARPRPRQAGPIAAGSSARAGALPPAPGGLAAAIFGAPVAMAPPPQRPRVRWGPTRGGQSRSLRLLSFHWAGALGGWFAGRRQIRGRAPWGSEAEGSDELPFVVRRARARGSPAAQDRLACRHVSRRRPGPTGHLPPGPR